MLDPASGHLQNKFFELKCIAVRPGCLESAVACKEYTLDLERDNPKVEQLTGQGGEMGIVRPVHNLNFDLDDNMIDVAAFDGDLGGLDELDLPDFSSTP